MSEQLLQRAAAMQVGTWEWGRQKEREAVVAVTREPFLVHTSNIFAMLGLRALYFLLSGIVERFRYIRVGLAGILIFLGAKLLLGDIVEFPIWVSLAVIAVALAFSVAASIIWPVRSGQYSAKTSSG